MEDNPMILPENSYFSFHRKLLRFLGVSIISADSRFKYLYYTYSILIFILSLGCTASLWMEVPELLEDIDGMMLNLTFGITYCTTYIKMIFYYKNHKLIREVTDISEGKQERILAYSKKTASEARSICMTMIRWVLIFANITVVGIFVGDPARTYYKYHYKNSSVPWNRVLPFPMKMPFNITTNGRYVLGFLYQIFCIQWYGNIVVLQNTFFVAIAVHLAFKFSTLASCITHVRRLAIIRLVTRSKNCIDLDDVIDPKRNLYYDDMQRKSIDIFKTEEVNEEISSCMRLCVIEHVNLIECVKKLEKAYNLGFLAHICNNLNIICHLMMQISENDIFSVRGGTAIALIGCVVSEFSFLCYAGNELTLQAGKVANCIYECDWIGTDAGFKRMQLIMMIRAHRPVVFTAGKFISISNTSCVTILRGAYSYFAVIKNSK